MRRVYDFLWVAVLFLVGVILIYKPTHEVFISATNTHPYIMGFIKVAILASMGELMALRIASGDWKKPAGFIYRVIVWGFLGMAFVIVFDIFANGVAAAMKNGKLPALAGGFSSKLAFAFFTSAFMNLIFAPTFMAFHRVTDTFIDLGEGQLGRIMAVKLANVINKIDWNGFISFVIIKTIPIFWIPAHTITFLLPPEYRVLMASFLSIAMGGILAFAKRKNTKTV